MKPSNYLFRMFFLFTLLCNAAIAEDKANIVILATGGTIAGSAATQTQAGYTSGQVGVDILLDAVPQINDLAEVRGEQVANVGSQDMSDQIWLKLAQRLNTLLAQSDVDGVVITHGTDTIEETAYFLNLTVKSDKPVVMTAAMRPSTALSADGPLNIFNAVAVAADPAARGLGVLVLANDDIHGARALTKTSTTDVQTFRSPEKGLIGVTLYGDNTFFRGPYRRFGKDSEFSVAEGESLPRVAGVGNGNMTAAALEEVEKAVKSGVVVVRSSRVPSGSVGRNVEVNDDEAGTVASGELNPAKARVLLKLALLKTSDADKIQQYFDQY